MRLKIKAKLAKIRSQLRLYKPHIHNFNSRYHAGVMYDFSDHYMIKRGCTSSACISWVAHRVSKNLDDLNGNDRYNVEMYLARIGKRTKEFVGMATPEEWDRVVENLEFPPKELKK